MSVATVVPQTVEPKKEKATKHMTIEEAIAAELLQNASGA